MPVPKTSPLDIRRAMRNAMIDRVTAEVVQAFAQAGIQPLLLKGPAIASWLYDRDEVRPYGDSDLMVSPDRHRDAVTVLTSLGFASELGPMDHPRMESGGSEPWVRGTEHVDLHTTVQGLTAPAQAIWARLSHDAVPMRVGGAEVSVLAPAPRLLHVALHAAQHQDSKPVWDLERAIARCPLELWREASALARELGGGPAFASGLRTTPDGLGLIDELGADEVSVQTLLRERGIPTAEGLAELLRTRRFDALAREFFPSAAFMRWWSPLARRGRRGMVAAYAWRVGYLLLNAPRAAVAVRSAHREVKRRSGRR